MPSHAVYDRVGPFYLHYYGTQSGRNGGGDGHQQQPVVYRGARRWQSQRGDGFGSVLRGLARFLLPVIGRGIGTFATHTLDAVDRGVSLGEAAKSALKPTLHAIVDPAAAPNKSMNGNGSVEHGHHHHHHLRKRKHNGDDKSDFHARMQAAKRRKASMKQSGRGVSKSSRPRKSKKRQQSGGGGEKRRVYKSRKAHASGNTNF